MIKVVYSCITGNYDPVRDPEVVNPEWQYILFTDQPISSGVWNIKPLQCPASLTSAVKMARWHKTHGPELFGPGALVIWHDGNMCMRKDPDQFISESLPKGYSIAAVKHPERQCIYQEADAILKLKKDVPEIVENQVQHLKDAGMPNLYGMTETGILIFRTTDKISLFMQSWWQEIEQYSHRDQLSFDYVRWRTKQRIHWLNPSIKLNVFGITRHPRKIPYGYDVVYVLGRGSKWDDNEIRYSIRSVKLNLKDLRNIVIIGHLPPWMRNVVHIPWPDNHSLTKDQIIIEKILAACRDVRVSDHFLFGCDDKVLLSPCEFKTFDGWHNGPIAEFERPTSWERGLIRTREFLISKGYPCNDYNSPHCFQPVDKKEFIEVMDQFNWKKDNLYGSSLYHNLSKHYKGSTTQQHVKIRGKNSYLSILRLIEGKISCNYNDPALNDAMRDTLSVLFPERSECEIYGTEGGAWCEYQEWLNSGKVFEKGVNLIRRHTNNRRLIIFFERKGNNPTTYKILERNLIIISKKWANMKIG